MILAYFDLSNKTAMFSLLLAFLFCGWLIVEKIKNNKYRKSFKHIVHVNGTRGKSTVTRLIAAGLRSSGYKVYSKTTGTIPTIINTKNESIPIKRKGKANIKEQIKMVRNAYKEGAEILVLECMAVDPVLQWICQHQILKADICVITNARNDHLEEMGGDVYGVANSLGNTIPDEGVLICGDDFLEECYKDKINHNKVKLMVANKDYEDPTIDLFPENLSTALCVCKALNLDEEKFIDGMRGYKKDPGIMAVHKVDNAIFINGFSINDPDSTMRSYELISNYSFFDKDKLTIIMNNRSDRPLRVKQHIELVGNLKPYKVVLCGGYQKVAKDTLENEYGLTNVEYYESCEKLLENELMFGIGNIANDGLEIIDFFEKKGEVIYG